MSGTCPTCTFLVERAWERCRFCGADLTAPDAEPPPPLPPTDDVVDPPPPGPATTLPGRTKPPSTASGISPAIAIGGAVLAVVVIFGGLRVLGDNERPAPADRASTSHVDEQDAPSEPATLRQLQGVCDGEGIPDAATFVGGPGRRPMEVVANRTDGWIRLTPPDRVDRSEELMVDEVQLVACRHALPEPTVSECAYETRPYIELEYHHEHVEIRDARTAAVVTEELVANPRSGCPRILWLENGKAQTNFYPDSEVNDLLLDLASDGTRPDLGLDEQLAAICRQNGGARRVTGAPDDVGGPATVLVHHPNEFTIHPELARDRAAPALAEAAYVVCLTTGSGHSDDRGACMDWHGRVVRLHDGETLFPSPDEDDLVGTRCHEGEMLYEPDAASIAAAIEAIPGAP